MRIRGALAGWVVILGSLGACGSNGQFGHKATPPDMLADDVYGESGESNSRENLA